jgi:glucan-binding YG repeat protein/ribosomal protein L21
MFSSSIIVPGNIGNWNVSNVKDMSEMFDNNHGGDIGDLSHWDTSNVIDMREMFYNSSTSASGLTHWNTKNVRDMSDMFDASDLPYKIVASNASAVIPNQVTLKDSTGKILALIDTPTIYNSNKSVRSTIDGIVQAEIDKLNKLNHTSYEAPKIISYGDDDYSIANATYVVNTESQSKTGLINYVDQDGKVIKTDTISGKVGDQINVNLSLPDGYELANKDEQIPSSITVGEDGINTITIQVKKLPVVQTGSINYVDQDGKVIKTDTISGKVGDQINVNLSLPDGYELANKDEHIPSSITVGEDGINTITIQVKKLPVVQTGSINYVDQDGKVIKTDTISGKVGDQINVNLSLPDGYELANKDEHIPSSITVGEDGINTITIQVKKLPVVQTGSINYVDQDGKVIKTDTISGKVGDQINVNLSLPDGYELANKDEHIPSSITVGEDGINTITIQVKKLPVVQTGSINYVDQDGKVIKTDTISGKVGDKVDVKLSLPDGYELANKDEQVPSAITIGDDGIKTININIKKIPVIKTGTINYIDPDGKVVKTDQVSGKVGDTIKVTLSLPDGYELANKDEHIPSVITVTENGIGTINVNVKKINTTNTGWNQQGDDWLYMQKNGYLAKGWNYLNGHWFYFDLQSGIMKTGIQSIGNSFYYLNAQHDGTYGAMKTGWQFVNGHWIGLQGSGNAYVGWQAINGHWYYFDPQTAYALTNWQDINNHWYYFDPTNAWAQTGWFKSGAGYWYFFDYANAWADTGWQKINNSWYYFDNVNANALTGWQSINNHWYYFDPTNAWALTGWQWINGHWYWFDQANAWARTGWQYYGGQWYFMDQQNAWMDTGWTTNLANGQLYYLDKNGHPLTGWQRSLNGFWYYLQPGSDAAAIGWNWINGYWYYFNPEETINGIKAKGAMFTGRHFIDNRWNRFDLNGHWLGYEN